MSTVKLCTLKICAALVTNVIVTVLYATERGSSTQRRLVVEDQEQRKRIVATIHDSNHLGINRTLDLVCSKYYWPGQSKDVIEYVSP